MAPRHTPETGNMGGGAHHSLQPAGVGVTEGAPELESGPSGVC